MMLKHDALSEEERTILIQKESDFRELRTHIRLVRKGVPKDVVQLLRGY